MDLNEINVYVKVYEAKSFVGAARALDMPKSTVSAKISALESRLGVTLIRRTTRRLFITDAGQDYYTNCIQALRQIANVEERIGQLQSDPRGRLRITAPIEIGESLFAEILAIFTKEYPNVDLEVILTDRTVDLVSEGFDLALRAGELKDSTLISRKLGSVFFAPFASPKYLKTNGTPLSPKDLKDHFCLTFAPFGTDGWTLSGPRGKQTVSLPRRMIVNDLNLVKKLATAGQGIALLPTFFCGDEIEDKSLVRILKDWKTNVRPIHFVYPAQEFVPRKLGAFLAVATERLREHFKKDAGSI